MGMVTDEGVDAPSSTADLDGQVGLHPEPGVEIVATGVNAEADEPSIETSAPEGGADRAVRIQGLVQTPQHVSPADLRVFDDLGRHLDADVYLLLHGRGAGPEHIQSLSEFVYEQFRGMRSGLVGRRAVLVIDSPGGQASAAYKIARLFQYTASEFFVAVPRYAMSAATLLSLGGRAIYMSSDAQIGPLDVQLHDREREEWGSALDEVQSLDQITAAAIAQADQAMFFLMQRSGKKLETLIPLALDFAAKLQAPMVEKIDTIHYSQHSRILKVAQDYAERLLSHHLDLGRAMNISQKLVHDYPEHGFVIDKIEASGFLTIPDDGEASVLLDGIGEFIDRYSPTIFGKIEVAHEQDDQGCAEAHDAPSEDH